MSNPSQKSYFLRIANKFNISPDVVRKIAYGETTGQSHSLVTRVLDTFVNHSQSSNELIFAMVWEGEPINNTVSNLPYYDWSGQVMEGINLRLHKTAYSTQLFFTNKMFADDEYYERLLKQRPGAGFIILQPGDMTALQKVCMNNKLPMILLAPSADTDLNLYYTIRIDDRASIKNLVSYIYDLGHRRIAFITGNLEHFSGSERLQGYYEGLKDFGLPLSEDRIFEGNWREDTGYAGATHFLNSETGPTAIIASNDQMAIGAIKSIQAAKLSVPDDISVVGCNDIASAVSNKPSLTTVQIPMTHIGHKASEYMMALLNGETPEPRHYRAGTKIITRESTAPPR